MSGSAGDSIMQVLRPPVAKASLPLAVKKRALEAGLSAIEELATAKGAVNLNFIDAVVVVVDDEAFAADPVSDEKQKALASLPGLYWKVGEVGGKICFRQEALPSDEKMAPNGRELFLWHNSKEKDAGWYWSDKPSIDASHMAWARNQENTNLPDVLHVPYWSKRAANGVEIMLLHHYAAWKLGGALEREKALEATVADLEAHVANLEGQVHCLSALKEIAKVGDEDDDKDKGSSHGKASSSKGKSKAADKGGKQRSGWLNKCKELVCAVLLQNYGVAKDLAREYATNSSMRPLLPPRIVNEATTDLESN
jgi:hypothetical protein